MSFTRSLFIRPLLVIGIFAVVASSGLSADAKWVSLFDGKTLKGWKHLDGQAKFEVRDGAIVGIVTEGVAQNSFIVTEDDTFTDFVFECEFRCDPGLNSGVQFRSRPADEKVKRVYGTQYEIDPTTRALTGGVQEEGGYGRRGPSNWLAPRDSKGELRDAWNKAHGDKFKPAPQWNTCRIECRGTHIKTWLNGELLADFDDTADVRIPHGFFGLQVHASKNPELFGREVAFRNLRVMRLE
jgi:hypothetical protein